MKKTLFLILFLLIIFSLFSQSEFQFVKYKWGATMDLIIMNEGIPNDKYDEKIFTHWDGIIYSNTRITDYSNNIRYEFFYNKLHMINYEIFDIHDVQKWIETYYYLRDKLKNIYGDYYLSHGIPDETDEQTIERIMLLFPLLNVEVEYLYDRTTFHRIVWNYFDTLIEMELYYDYNIDDLRIGIWFSSPDYYKYINELFDKNFHN